MTKQFLIFVGYNHVFEMPKGQKIYLNLFFACFSALFAVSAAAQQQTDRQQAKLLMEKGDSLRCLYRFDESLSAYEKALEIDKALAEETSTVQSYNDLALSYCKLGLLLSNREYLQKALDIWKKLSERCPDVAMYKKYAWIAERELRKIG